MILQSDAGLNLLEKSEFDQPVNLQKILHVIPLLKSSVKLHFLGLAVAGLPAYIKNTETQSKYYK